MVADPVRFGLPGRLGVEEAPLGRSTPGISGRSGASYPGTMGIRSWWRRKQTEAAAELACHQAEVRRRRDALRAKPPRYEMFRREHKVVAAAVDFAFLSIVYVVAGLMPLLVGLVSLSLGLVARRQLYG